MNVFLDDKKCFFEIFGLTDVLLITLYVDYLKNDPDQAYPDEESVQVGEYVPLHWEDGGEELEQEEGGQEGEGDARREATRQDITLINSI